MTHTNRHRRPTRALTRNPPVRAVSTHCPKSDLSRPSPAPRPSRLFGIPGTETVRLFGIPVGIPGTGLTGTGLPRQPRTAEKKDNRP